MNTRLNPEPPLILLTNDDGFYSEGIERLREEMLSRGDVYIVAPDRERSATSQALTLHHPLRAHEVREHVFSVDGTPADCIYLAVQALLPRSPDLILSGINPGPNVGQQDVSYSGTVAGAFQGGYLGIPSLAVSLVPDGDGHCAYAFTAGIAARLADAMLKNTFPSGVILNLNVPPPPLRGLRAAGLGEKRYHPEVITRKDPRNREYFWIGTGTPKAVGAPDSDVMSLRDGYAVVTPLQRDLTDYSVVEQSNLRVLLGNIEHEMA